MLSIYGDSANAVFPYVENNSASGNSAVDRQLRFGVGGGTASGISIWQNSGVVEGTPTGGLALTAADAAGSIKFGIGVSRSELMRLTHDGKLGLGTTSPTTKLHVRSNSSAAARIASTNTNSFGQLQLQTSSQFLIGYGSTHGYQANEISLKNTVGDITFYTGGSERVRINSSGNVGIGNTNPSQPLDVTGWVKTSVGLLGTYGRVGVGGSGGPEITTGGLANPIKFIGGNNSTNLERMRIDGSGRLLLGTTTEGQASADDFTIADSGDVGITLRSTSSNQTQISFSDGTSGTAEYAGQIAYDHSDDHMRFRTAATERLRINSNGAWGIEGASNYGTSGQVLTSNGNDSPTWQDAAGGGAGGANAISMNDSVKINFGAGNDLQIYHDGSNSYIADAGTGNLIINATNLQVKNHANNATYFTATNGGAFTAYHNNVYKFATKSDGVNVIGELECDSLDVDGGVDIDGGKVVYDATNDILRWADGARATFGASNDLQIKHDGSTSLIDNNTGGLSIRQLADDQDIVLSSDNGSGGDTAYVRCDGSTGEVKLYHYGAQKLNTTSSGINVGGSITCDGLVVDGTFTQSNGTGHIVLQDDNNTGNSTLAYVEGRDSGNTQKWYVGHASTGNQDLYINNSAGGQIRFRSSNADRIIMQAAGHFVPQTNNSIDLGSSSTRWRNVYTNDLNLSNEGSANDVDGTWGNYTIQEGEDDLFLINRRSGKKYKFNLTEVS